MALTHSASASSPTDPLSQLRQLLSQLLPHQALSVAGVLRVVRSAMTERRSRSGLRARLGRALIDDHPRWSAKRKRHWPVKARLHRCGTLLARTANVEEIARYQAILAKAA